MGPNESPLAQGKEGTLEVRKTYLGYGSLSFLGYGPSLPFFGRRPTEVNRDPAVTHAAVQLGTAPPATLKRCWQEIVVLDDSAVLAGVEGDAGDHPA